MHKINFSATALSDLIQSVDFSCKTGSSFLDCNAIVEDSLSIFHTSVPNIKLYYPEPFIATPTFIHDDIWFLHIVIYQYWLWFGFIYMIIFFFLAFLITVRWCNVRHRPVRETRGVSRSKCGDLITATVPVSWAASIIIHESTDAIELSDGFGTAEMAVGIRAYQWGWEYYYPKDMDLKFYNQKSLSIGKSSSNFFNSSVTSDHAKFKNSLITADILDVSNMSHLACFEKDFGYRVGSHLGKDTPVGLNKLIARASTSLITSSKLLNAANLTASQDSTLINALFSYYWSNVWEDQICSKPEYYTSNFATLSAKDAFFFNTAYSSLHDLNLYISRNLPFKRYSALASVNTALLFNNVSSSLESSTLHLSPLQTSLNVSETAASEVAPLFSGFKSLDIPNFTRLASAKNALFLINSSSQKPFSLYADQDFKRWSAHEMIEDLSWSEFAPSSDLVNPTNSLNLFNIKDYQSFFGFKPEGVFLVPFAHSESAPRLLVFNNFFKRTFNSSFSVFKQLNFSHFSKFITSSNQLNPMSQLDLSSFFSNVDQSSDFRYEQNYFSLITDGSLTLPIFQTPTSDLTPIFKNFSTYYQAFWKVFKSTLDEERTLFNYSNFSNTDFRLPLVMQTPLSLMSLLQKSTTKSPLYDVSFFARSVRQSSTLKLDVLGAYFSYHFPFMLSFESDIIRYTWLDWYSFKSLITTKSKDTSVFGLNGAKQYEFSFTKDPKMEFINRIDNYVTNYSAARRYLLPSALYRPFFYSKFNELNPSHLLYDLLTTKTAMTTNSALLLYRTYLILDSYPRPTYLPDTSSLYSSVSSWYTPNHNFYFSYKLLSSKFDHFNTLLDIMSKRNYLFKSLNASSASINNLSPLWLELRSLPEYAPTGRFALLKKYKMYPTPLTSKSQYVPLKKGIVNMIRIQADKAIAMPTDTRLQILAVSKDIIHSWSIPSAGIKIDCIPGYSSHRIAMFTVSGIYWGQCMEICGRFHHWMPIVVYFLRRDLFCLWCTHFIFNNKQVNSIYQGYDGRVLDSNYSIYTPTSAWNFKL